MVIVLRPTLMSHPARPPMMFSITSFNVGNSLYILSPYHIRRRHSYLFPKPPCMFPAIPFIMNDNERFLCRVSSFEPKKSYPRLDYMQHNVRCQTIAETASTLNAKMV
jgi:hypothetical protein